MQRIVLAGEVASEIRIAFPVRRRVAIGEAGVFSSIAAGEAAMRQRVGPGVANRIAWFGATGEVTFLLFGIAPNAAWIPVPGLDLQIGILAIGDGLPPGVENLLENGIGEHVIRGAGSEAVHARAESANGAERIHGVGGSGVNDDALRRGNWREGEQRGDATRDYFGLRHSVS